MTKTTSQRARTRALPKAIQIRFSEDEFKAIEAIAVEEDRGLGAVVRRLFRAGLAARASAATAPATVTTTAS